jgi:dihydrofolate synthase/folylpolyglutamate synthase
MTYGETLEYMFNQLPAYHMVGKAAYKGDLLNTIALDKYFGHPHLKFPSIHVAGTNGKGSVSHMIASVLQEAGYKTGLFTSPHLLDFRERIRVNGDMIPEATVVGFVCEHREIFEEIKPSFFEMTVFMAFEYFKKSAVDAAVIEVGLGGRLDSTNIISPVLSVITNIGHDHMDLLGDTLEKIAVEKAGIIKKAVPLIISETQHDLKNIFISMAQNEGSPITFADERFSCFFHEDDRVKSERSYLVEDLKTTQQYEGISVLCGDYQLRNLKAVYSSSMNLKSVFSISDLNISDGIRNVIRNTGFAGRWHVLDNEPFTICDTAHNREGLEIVLAQIKRIPKSDLHIVLGFVNDKDLDSVLPLFPVEANYYFTRASVPRALNEDILKEAASKYGLSGECFPDVLTALARARKKSAKSDLIFIGGSTFVVGDVIKR